MSMLAGQRDVIEAIAAPVLASSARTDVKAKLQFAVIASFGSGSIRHGRARSARPPEAVEPDDEEVPARMKTVVQYLVAGTATLALAGTGFAADRKSTRLNSSHLVISYAVFCLKKKKKKKINITIKKKKKKKKKKM